MAKNKVGKRLQKVEYSVQTTLDQLDQLLLIQETDAEYIHSIRVHIKHLRAWLRLLRVNTENIKWREMDRELGDLAKSLGRARDVQVINAMVSTFMQHTDVEHERRVLKKLLHNSSQDKTVHTVDWPLLKQHLRKQLAIYQQYFLYIRSINGLRKNLMRNYKKTIKSANAVFANDCDFNLLHRFRKDVKGLYYQSCYLRNGFKRLTKIMVHNLHLLGDLLGDTHDLDIIRKYVHGLPGRRFNRNDRATVENILAGELRSLLNDSRVISSVIFSATTPKKLAKYIK